MRNQKGRVLSFQPSLRHGNCITVVTVDEVAEGLVRRKEVPEVDDVRKHRRARGDEERRDGVRVDAGQRSATRGRLYQRAGLGRLLEDGGEHRQDPVFAARQRDIALLGMGAKCVDGFAASGREEAEHAAEAR